jgi:hypothetical protein
VRAFKRPPFSTSVVLHRGSLAPPESWFHVDLKSRKSMFSCRSTWYVALKKTLISTHTYTYTHIYIPYCTVTNPRFENPQVINPNANNARGAHIINKHSASLCEVLLALWLHVHEYSRACVRMYREATSWKGTYIDALEVITWLGYIQTQNVS